MEFETKTKRGDYMKYEYTGRHIEVTPALRSHVENHFKKLDHLFGQNNAKAHIIIEVEKGRHRSEIILKWRDHVLTANSSVSDMYQSLTKTIDKIEKQASKLKNKVIDRHHKAEKISTITAKREEIKLEPGKPRIIHSKRHSIKPMTAEEAILKLNVEENQFLVFRDAVTERVSVLYKRKDGNYGLIQP
jgi:putative sigma-54 modulation protein